MADRDHGYGGYDFGDDRDRDHDEPSRRAQGEHPSWRDRSGPSGYGKAQHGGYGGQRGDWREDPHYGAYPSADYRDEGGREDFGYGRAGAGAPYGSPFRRAERDHAGRETAPSGYGYDRGAYGRRAEFGGYPSYGRSDYGVYRDQGPWARGQGGGWSGAGPPAPYGAHEARHSGSRADLYGYAEFGESPVRAKGDYGRFAGPSFGGFGSIGPSRSVAGPYGGQELEYHGYGHAAAGQIWRSDHMAGYRYERDRRRATAGGPGAYGEVRSSAQPHSAYGDYDPDYLHWRDSQIQSFDRDYHSWRQERRDRFAKEFDAWRSQRGAQPAHPPGPTQPGPTAQGSPYGPVTPPTGGPQSFAPPSREAHPAPESSRKS
jgi:hypothetical protein